MNAKMDGLKDKGWGRGGREGERDRERERDRVCAYVSTSVLSIFDNLESLKVTAHVVTCI